MRDQLRRVLDSDERILYALLFGSTSRGTSTRTSDVDLAIGLGPDVRLTSRELGGLVARLEEAVGRAVDLVVLDDAPPGLAYRVFRDGQVVLERDRAAMVGRKARAILEYLDYKPVEEACSRGVLAAASRGR